MRIVTSGIAALACVAVLVTLNGRADGETMKDQTLRLFSVKAGGYVELPADNRSQAEWKQVLTPEQFRVSEEDDSANLAPISNKLRKHVPGDAECV